MPERYRQLFAHFADPLFVEDAAGVILDANPAAAAMLGVPLDQLLGRYSSEFIDPGSLERLSPLLKGLRSDGRLRLEAQYIGAGGSPVSVDLLISMIPWADGESATSPTSPTSPTFPTVGRGNAKSESAYLIVARPCGPRDDVERELSAQRESAVKDPLGLPKAIFFVTSQNTVTRYPAVADAKAAPLDWVSNLILSPALKSAMDRAWAGNDVLLPPAWYSTQAIPAGANISGALAAVAEEARLAELAGQRHFWLRIALTPVRSQNGISGILVQALDCTPQRVETEQADVAEDQTVLAMLTASIHHELNNYLSVILAQASAMRMALPQGKLPPPSVGAIMDASQEAVGFLRRSADLLGRVDGAVPETDLNAIVSDTAHLLRHILPPGLGVRADLGLDVPLVRTDARLMRTLILILARHLQTRLAAGTLTLKTFRPEQPYPSLIQAAFSIEDSGSRSTTPASAPGARPAAGGHGTEAPNITLARAIARYHRAQLEVITTAQGTVIELHMPGVDLFHRDGQYNAGTAATASTRADGGESEFKSLSRTAGQGPRPRESVPLPNDPAQGQSSRPGAKRILIADDEESFRTFMGWALRQHGYDVVLASNGQEAFERFQESPASFSLAILDAYMPLMGGLETYLRMQVLRPELPVLFASGFVRGPSVETLIDGCPGPATVLLKPFSAEDLNKAVEFALAPAAEENLDENSGDDEQENKEEDDEKEQQHEQEAAEK